MVIDKPFERFELGERSTSRARTITEADLVMFAAFTGDWYPLHTDAEYVKATPFGQRIAHGMLVLSVATGLSRLEPGYVVAFYGMDHVRFTAPTFIGDTIHVESVVVRLDDKGAKGGVVTLQSEVKKHTGETVVTARMKVLVSKEKQG